MQNKKYTPKQEISYQFGQEIRRAGEKMQADKMPVANTYGFVDLFVINDSKNGINLTASLNHIKNRLDYFSKDFYVKLQEWEKTEGKFSIDRLKITLGMVDALRP